MRIWYRPADVELADLPVGTLFRTITAAPGRSATDPIHWYTVLFRVDVLPDIRGDLARAFVQVSRRDLLPDETERFEGTEPSHRLDDSRTLSLLPAGAFD